MEEGKVPRVNNYFPLFKIQSLMYIGTATKNFCSPPSNLPLTEATFVSQYVQLYIVLGFEPDISWMLGKHSTN